MNNNEYNQNNESVNLRIDFNIRIEIDNVNDANITMKSFTLENLYALFIIEKKINLQKFSFV